MNFLISFVVIFQNFLMFFFTNKIMEQPITVKKFPDD